MGDKADTSAQVVLKAGTEAELKGARDLFAGAGFSVGPLVATNFSISGPADKFEEFLNVRLTSAGGGMKFITKDREARELSADDLPDSIRDAVENIVFTEPPAFGPFNP